MEAKAGWYLVYTKVHQEMEAKLNLQNQGFEIYFPTLQQHKHRRNLYQVVTEPLFPRYLFVQLNPEVTDWSKIRSTRGCISLVRFGTLPARIPHTLIEQLKGDEAKRLLQKQTTTPDFKPGDAVRIIDGVLSNYEGIVATKNSQERVTLLLKISETHTCKVNVSVHQVMATS